MGTRKTETPQDPLVLEENIDRDEQSGLIIETANAALAVAQESSDFFMEAPWLATKHS